MDRNVAMMLVALAVVVIGLVIWLSLRRRRSADLRRHFGPEYEHTLREKGSASRAEAELEHRAKRVQRMHLRPLAADLRQRYAERWKKEQVLFVDEPKVAIDDADHLVEEVMIERGYPVGEFDQRVADISVDHPGVVENYRAAHEIAERGRRGQASTEDLRQAMVYYRNLFMDLLEEPIPAGAPKGARTQ